VIKFVSDLQQVSGFLWVFRFPPPTFDAVQCGNGKRKFNHDAVELKSLLIAIRMTRNIVLHCVICSEKYKLAACHACKCPIKIVVITNVTIAFKVPLIFTEVSTGFFMHLLTFSANVSRYM
jgi:hypothetical protein